MSTPLVVSVTDELVAELEEACREHGQGFMVETEHVLRLLAERAEFRRLLLEQEQIMQSLRDSEWALIGEREELLRDAERYRWLRQSMWYVGPDNFFCGEGGDMNDYENHNYRADTLDAAIDAAMQSEAKQ